MIPKLLNCLRANGRCFLGHPSCIQSSTYEMAGYSGCQLRFALRFALKSGQKHEAPGVLHALTTLTCNLTGEVLCRWGDKPAGTAKACALMLQLRHRDLHLGLAGCRCNDHLGDCPTPSYTK